MNHLIRCTEWQNITFVVFLPKMHNLIPSFFFLMLIYFCVREKAQEQAGEVQRERGTEDLKQLRADSREPDVGLHLANQEIMT